MRAKSLQLALLPFLAAAMVATAEAAERHFTFGYDQPHTTAYGYAADVFAAKLKELEHRCDQVLEKFEADSRETIDSSWFSELR